MIPLPMCANGLVLDGINLPHSTQLFCIKYAVIPQGPIQPQANGIGWQGATNV
jgi:hypothetical protein